MGAVRRLLQHPRARKAEGQREAWPWESKAEMKRHVEVLLIIGLGETGRE